MLKNYLIKHSLKMKKLIICLTCLLLSCKTMNYGIFSETNNIYGFSLELPKGYVLKRLDGVDSNHFLICCENKTSIINIDFSNWLSTFEELYNKINQDFEEERKLIYVKEIKSMCLDEEVEWRIIDFGEYYASRIVLENPKFDKWNKYISLTAQAKEVKELIVLIEILSTFKAK